eukprot:767292-Hanusia_phi.AAC.6
MAGNGREERTVSRAMQLSEEVFGMCDMPGRKVTGSDDFIKDLFLQNSVGCLVVEAQRIERLVLSVCSSSQRRSDPYEAQT